MEKNTRMKISFKPIWYSKISFFIFLSFRAFFLTAKEETIVPLEEQISDETAKQMIARLTYAAGFFEESISLYQELLTPTVDQFLLQSLLQPDDFCWSPIVLNEIERLSESVRAHSIYMGYERFTTFFNEYRFALRERSLIEEILSRYSSIYLFQKEIFLESLSKQYDWENKPLHASSAYQMLSSLIPKNEEALYCTAQNYSALGLSKEARDLYDQILTLNRKNTLAQMALSRNLQKESLLLRSNYFYWKERGQGQFSQSQIARQQFDEVVEWSPTSLSRVRFIQSGWLEFPFFNHNQYYPAEGQAIEIDQQFYSFLSGSAGVAYKNYFHQFISRTTCFANLKLNCNDFFNLSIGFEKRNEIYNLYSLKEGTQAKVYWFSIDSTLMHDWTMESTYRHFEYNDKNQMDLIEVNTTFIITHDPHLFKIIVGGNYLNTTHLSRVIFNQSGKIKNVIHPYWTPQHYYSNWITLAYRHRFSFLNFCEAPLHFIDVRITGETDTDRNPSLQLMFEWKHEFMSHWGFSLEGMIHQSRLWNAEGAWMNVYYRF